MGALCSWERVMLEHRGGALCSWECAEARGGVCTVPLEPGGVQRIRPWDMEAGPHPTGIGMLAL